MRPRRRTVNYFSFSSKRKKCFFIGRLLYREKVFLGHFFFLKSKFQGQNIQPYLLINDNKQCIWGKQYVYYYCLDPWKPIWGTSNFWTITCDWFLSQRNVFNSVAFWLYYLFESWGYFMNYYKMVIMNVLLRFIRESPEQQ